jgi:hypothetical protein
MNRYRNASQSDEIYRENYQRNRPSDDFDSPIDRMFAEFNFPRVNRAFSGLDNFFGDFNSISRRFDDMRGDMFSK